MTHTIRSQQAIRAIAIAVSCVASSFAAHAGTEASLYGVADVYAAYQKGDRSEFSVDSGGLAGSRIGVSASHDISPDLKAIAKIEAGVNLDTGTNGQGTGVIWGRQAYGGLAGGFGSLTLGRQYTLEFNALDTDDPFDTGAGSAISSGIVTSLGGVRANNSIVYAAPKFGGFDLSLMAAAGEATAGSTSNGDLFSANLRYSAGPIGIGLTLSHLNKPVDGDVAASAVLLAGTWDAGSFSLMGGAQAVHNATQAANTQDDRTEFFAGARVPVGADEFWLGTGTGSTKHVDGTRATQGSVAWLHHLDKSATIYAVATTLHNGSATSFTIDTATGNGPAVSPGQDASGLQVGFLYRF